MIRKYLVGILLCLPIFAFSQQYTGMSGLIHVPSADMDQEGNVRIGSHFLNKQFLPDEAFDYDGKYHSADFYASITPFSWVEIGYTFTLRKGNRGYFAPDDIGYHRKDQYISFKIQPLKEREGKWWPSLAVGTNDPKTGARKKDVELEKNKNQHFGNYYIAATKHLHLDRHIIGFNLAYRRFIRTYNRKWDGMVGGVTYQPCFAHNLRVIVEYTGKDINIGADCRLWNHLLVQVSMQNGKYLTGGLCYTVNLF